MKVTAVIGFRDPKTRRQFEPGDTVTGLSKGRIDLLLRRGWVKEQEPPTPKAKKSAQDEPTEEAKE